MLKDLTREDWLSILGLPRDRIPAALILRGTRNLRKHYTAYQQYFTDIMEVGTPNGVLEDVFIGRLGEHPVAYASVYGAPMASEMVHVFGVLGTPLVIQTGCCGALADGISTGDLVVADRAYCGEGAAQYYEPGGKTVAATLKLQDWIAGERLDGLELYSGQIYTTSALFAEGLDDVEAWFQAGNIAVDMETAATFAVARYFNMDCLSILYTLDNPRQKEHLLLNDAVRSQRRKAGNIRVIQLTLDLVREYSSRKPG